MMGERQTDQPAFFYAFSLERHVPSDAPEADPQARPPAPERSHRSQRRMPPRHRGPEPEETRPAGPDAGADGSRLSRRAPARPTHSPADRTDFFNNIGGKRT